MEGRILGPYAFQEEEEKEECQKMVFWMVFILGVAEDLPFAHDDLPKRLVSVGFVPYTHMSPARTLSLLL